MPSVELLSAYTKLDIKGREKMDKALGGVRKSAVSMEAALNKAAVAANRVMLVGAGVIGLSIKQAATAEAAAGKFNAVFKSQSEAVEAWAKTYGESVGRTTLQLKPFLSTLQDTFVPMGFAREEAAEMSKQLTQLGLDLASFNDVADADAINSLTSALVGNHEAVRRFGIVITAATLDAELLAMGHKSVAKGATEQQKAQARLNLIMKSSTDAQGDLKKTQGEINNQYKKMTGQVQELMVELGKAFIPALNELLPLLTDMAKAIAEWVKENKEAIPGMVKWTAGLLILVSQGPKAVALLRGMAAAYRAIAAAQMAGGVGGLAKGAAGKMAIGAGGLAGGAIALFGAQLFRAAAGFAEIDNAGKRLRASMLAEEKARRASAIQGNKDRAKAGAGVAMGNINKRLADAMAMVKAGDYEGAEASLDRLRSRRKINAAEIKRRGPGADSTALAHINEQLAIGINHLREAIETDRAERAERDTADFNRAYAGGEARQAVAVAEAQEKAQAKALPEAAREFATTSAAGLQSLFQQREDAYAQRMLDEAKEQNDNLENIDDGVGELVDQVGNLEPGFG